MVEFIRWGFEWAIRKVGLPCWVGNGNGSGSAADHVAMLVPSVGSMLCGLLLLACSSWARDEMGWSGLVLLCFRCEGYENVVCEWQWVFALRGIGLLGEKLSAEAWK